MTPRCARGRAAEMGLLARIQGFRGWITILKREYIALNDIKCITGFGGGLEEGAPTIGAEGRCGDAGSPEKSFLEALCQEGLRRGEEVVFVDEMGVGLLG